MYVYFEWFEKNLRLRGSPHCCAQPAPSQPRNRTHSVSLSVGNPLLWHHNEHDSVSNHQPRGCLLDRLFRRRSKKTSKLRVTGLCVGNSPGPVNSPHKGPVTRKMFPFDDVIMHERYPYSVTHKQCWLFQWIKLHLWNITPTNSSWLKWYLTNILLSKLDICPLRHVCMCMQAPVNWLT